MMEVDNFKFVVREYKTYQQIGDKLYNLNCIGIGLHCKESDIIYPLPLTNFIRSVFRRKRNGSLSSQRNPANEVCKFLNYCFEMKNKGYDEFQGLRGISDIKLIHGSIYISDLSIRSRNQKINGGYVNDIIKYLKKFYAWLHHQKIIEPEFEVKYHIKSVKNSRGEIFEIMVLEDMFAASDFETIYPTGKSKKEPRLKDFGKNRYQMVREFLEVTAVTAPDIYLGVCLQFFGGLRRSEVVNLNRTSILEKAEGFYLDIDDRQDTLFPNKKNSQSEQVKNPRYQSIFWNSTLEYAWKEHIKRLDFGKEKQLLKNEEALLVSSRTMKPITGSSYWYQFNKVKDAYLTKLSKEGRKGVYDLLANVEWSTHICRGVFTHFCIDAGMSLSEIAIARGDSNLNSLLDYIEEVTVMETMAEAMNKIGKVFNEKGEKITATIAKKNKFKW